MSFDVRVPVVGESVQEGGIYKWHKKSGDFVNRDDVLLELETDKATVEIVAEASGVLETLVKEGDTVKVGDVIARIEGNGKAAPPAPARKEDTAPTAKAAPAKEVAAPPKGGAQPLSPAVERMVKEQNLDPNLITGTGKGGRITKEDVVNFVESRETKEPSRPISMPPPPTTTPVSTPTIAPSAGRGERREKMSRLRQRIAERLVEAQHNAAMLTTFNEIDMSAVMDVRKRYKDAFKEHHQVNLGFMSFFVKAAVNALKEFQGINAYIDGTDIIYHDYYDVGIAVSTDKGLIVPVVRNADALTFAEIEKTIGEYAAKGREGKIALDDLSGGTFTITNGGVFGSLLSTPILNPPQSAILGMHKIQQRPMVIDNEIVIRPMMYVALSYDHRIVDGKEAVGFLVKIKENIEDPARLLLGV